MKPADKALRALLPILACFCVAGCETTPVEPFPEFNSDMEVITDYAQFFRLGPQQAGGADRSLRQGERVMLHRKQFGYSRVQLENGQIGYMANEDIQPAPPEPRAPAGRRGAAPARSSGADTSWDDDRFDDFSNLNPSLDILPEDVPLEPLPDLMPDPADLMISPPVVPAPVPDPTPIREIIPAPAPETSPVSTST